MARKGLHNLWYSRPRLAVLPPTLSILRYRFAITTTLPGEGRTLVSPVRWSIPRGNIIAKNKEELNPQDEQVEAQDKDAPWTLTEHGEWRGDVGEALPKKDGER